jgi:hypothetical protein
MVAVATGPEKRAINGSKPPGGIACPAALVPPPNPQVWKVTMLEEGSVKVVSKTLSGVASVPVKEMADPLAVTASTHTASTLTRLFAFMSALLNFLACARHLKGDYAARLAGMAMRIT